MIISIIGDSHLNKVSYRDVRDHIFTTLSFRAIDFMNSFEYMVDKNLNEIHPDIIILAGDVYDNYDPSNTVRTFFSRQVRRIVDAGIVFIVLTGQHDICRKNHALQPIKELAVDRLKIVDKPYATKYKDMNLLLFPYPLQAAQRRITVKSLYAGFVDHAHKKLQNNNDTLMVAHMGIKGAVKKTYLNKDMEVSNTVNADENDISVKDLASSGASHIVLGDYHKHQILNMPQGYAMYTGSIERTDITEAKQDKGFIVFDSEAEEIQGYGKCRFIPYPNVRPMLDMKGTIVDLNSQLQQLDENINKGAIVRVTFQGKVNEISDMESARIDFEKRMKKKIKPVVIRTETDIYDAEEIQKAQAMENALMQEGHITKDDVMDAVKTIIEENQPDKKEREILISMAQELYEEGQEEN